MSTICLFVFTYAIKQCAYFLLCLCVLSFDILTIITNIM